MYALFDPIRCHRQRRYIQYRLLVMFTSHTESDVICIRKGSRKTVRDSCRRGRLGWAFPRGHPEHRCSGSLGGDVNTRLAMALSQQQLRIDYWLLTSNLAERLSISSSTIMVESRTKQNPENSVRGKKPKQRGTEISRLLAEVSRWGEGDDLDRSDEDEEWRMMLGMLSFMDGGRLLAREDLLGWSLGILYGCLEAFQLTWFTSFTKA